MKGGADNDVVDARLELLDPLVVARRIGRAQGHLFDVAGYLTSSQTVRRLAGVPPASQTDIENAIEALRRAYVELTRLRRDLGDRT